MCTAQEYRTIADNQRRLAALSDFPLMRDRYLASADKWDFLAQEKSLAEGTQAGRSESETLMPR